MQAETHRRANIVRTVLGLIALIATLELTAPSGAAAERACWQRVLADWSDGDITGSYPVQCYRDALRRMPEDVRLYSNAAQDIGRALADRLAPERGVASVRPVGAATPMSNGGRGFPEAPVLLAGALGAAGIAAGAAIAIRRGRKA